MCAPDDGWIYHPKHVELFPDVKCVKLHLVGYILEATQLFVVVSSNTLGLRAVVTFRKESKFFFKCFVTLKLLTTQIILLYVNSTPL